VRLLTSGKSNSLAASLEILSYLRQHGLKGEVLHGCEAYITARIQVLAKAEKARRQLQGMRLGIVGKPSDWLIASDVDAAIIKERLGIELLPLEIPVITEQVEGGKEGALVIYEHLRALAEQQQLQGFTIRCFDLLTAVHNTGCLALAKLNAEGLIAGCEGDVPAMLSMAIVNALTGVSGFQANPASINPETGEVLFAHCTIPLNMVERYELDTHFESGIGVGIRGYMKEGPVTIFKVSGDLSRSFMAEGTLVRNQAKPDLCRTQQVIQLADKLQANYFLTHPIGNHHIVMPGLFKAVLSEITASLLVGK
jgi:L-fucose isomerase-like protein